MGLKLSILRKLEALEGYFKGLNEKKQSSGVLVLEKVLALYRLCGRAIHWQVCLVWWINLGRYLSGADVIIIV